MPECVDRRIGNIQVSTAELLEFIAFKRPSRILMIVEKRNLPDVARKSGRQFARGIHVAEQNVR